MDVVFQRSETGLNLINIRTMFYVQSHIYANNIQVYIVHIMYSKVPCKLEIVHKFTARAHLSVNTNTPLQLWSTPAKPQQCSKWMKSNKPRRMLCRPQRTHRGLPIPSAHSKGVLSLTELPLIQRRWQVALQRDLWNHNKVEQVSDRHVPFQTSRTWRDRLQTSATMWDPQHINNTAPLTTGGIKFPAPQNATIFLLHSFFIFCHLCSLHPPHQFSLTLLPSHLLQHKNGEDSVHTKLQLKVLARGISLCHLAKLSAILASMLKHTNRKMSSAKHSGICCVDRWELLETLSLRMPPHTERKPVAHWVWMSEQRLSSTAMLLCWHMNQFSFHHCPFFPLALFQSWFCDTFLLMVSVLE